MTQINLTYFNGLNAVGVVDFSGTGEAGMAVTINGVAYTEADTADAEDGVWTNGASAANSATSLAAAINGDIRYGKPDVAAVVSDEGNSVVLLATRPGSEFNYTVTTDSEANCTVENMHGGVDAGRRKVAMVDYVVTAQDVKADECNIVLPFDASGFVVNARTTAGVNDAHTAAVTLIAASDGVPARLRYNFAGATDAIAGDVIHAVIWE